MMVSDFHSHILPRIDDGSASLEESVKMLRMEQNQGISRVVATPHFYAHRDTMDRFLHRRERAAEQLREALADHPDLPQVILGAEVYFFPGISETEALGELTIAGTDCVLIEMPVGAWTDKMYRELEQIPEKQGLQPIIAHVDRYMVPLHKNSHITRLLQLPVLIQANAGFFLRRSTVMTALRMLKQDKIQFLGSDCHNLDTRAPNLGPAVERIRKKLGDDPLLRICQWENTCLESKGNKESSL